ncbi:MAG: TatD family hydrolase [Planctomycetes bacterium]|nr:TatD family hydrolase [Planctomycetota bacterium]
MAVATKAQEVPAALPTMALFDSHAHLTYPELLGQIDAVIARCDAAGVERTITVGTSLAEIDKALALAERFPGRVLVAAGIHPHEAGKVTQATWAPLAKAWEHPAVVAFGEMGLDYHYDFADRGAQREAFARQLGLAAGRDKPIVIHSREALPDTVAVLREHGFQGRPVVFHCFTGNAEEAARIAAEGWRISFTGIVTFKRSTELQAIARDYPAEKLMIETDAPYLSPEPVRGRRPCEPAFVAHTARFLAALRGVDYDQLAALTSANTCSFFGC